MISKDFIRDPVFPECPIRNILARIGSKWTMAVLYTLGEAPGAMRFRDIEQKNPDCSQKMPEEPRLLAEDADSDLAWVGGRWTGEPQSLCRDAATRGICPYRPWSFVPTSPTATARLGLQQPA